MAIAPDDVRPVLRGFEVRIREVLEGAWKEWRHIPDLARFSARSRASMIFDFVKRRAVAEFDGDQNIRIIPKGQTAQFLFRDRVLVRFKKANGAGLGSNIQTQAVLQFIDPQLSIPGLLPDIFRIEVCYHLDKLATRMDRLAVTARECSRKLWSYDLERPSSGEVAHLPPAPPSPELPPPQVRVRKPKAESQTGE